MKTPRRSKQKINHVLLTATSQVASFGSAMVDKTWKALSLYDLALFGVWFAKNKAAANAREGLKTKRNAERDALDAVILDLQATHNYELPISREYAGIIQPELTKKLGFEPSEWKIKDALSRANKKNLAK